MSVNVPQPSIEKPITVVDYCAGLAECITVAEVARYSAACPDAVRADERFTRAVAGRLAGIKGRKRA
jgi:hypothetical protein